MLEGDKLEDAVAGLNGADYDNVFTFIERVNDNIEESDYDEDEKEQLRKNFKEKVLEIL